MKRSQLRARYWRIVFFFGRVTASFIVWEVILPRVGLAGWSARGRSERYRAIAVRFRALAIRMGGLMIKVGQFLSARLDVLPPEITDELAGLQDEVPAVEFAAIREKAEAELGRSFDDAYSWVDETPMAAASLGQVHRARLCEAEAELHGFDDVVVKVQRPFIEQVVEVDLAAIRRVGGWLQRYKPVSKRADVPALVEEFAATTREEIDYIAEAKNAERFSANFEGDSRIHVPKVVWDLTHAPRADARECRGDQARRLRSDHRSGNRPRAGRLGVAGRLYEADPRGRLLPRRPAPGQSLRHAAGGHQRGRQHRMAADVHRLRHDGAGSRQPPRGSARGAHRRGDAGRCPARTELHDARRAPAQRRPEAHRDGPARSSSSASGA